MIRGHYGCYWTPIIHSEAPQYLFSVHTCSDEGTSLSVLTTVLDHFAEDCVPFHWKCSLTLSICTPLESARSSPLVVQIDPLAQSPTENSVNSVRQLFLTSW